MVRWCERLYFDHWVEKNIEKVRKQIEKGTIQLSIYCICMAQNPKNLFDILNANELLFKYYKRKEIKIIGLARSRAAAEEMLVEIVGEMYQNTGGFQVENYFNFSEQRTRKAGNDK